MKHFHAGDILLCIDDTDSQGRLQMYQLYTCRHDSYDAFVVLEETGLTEWFVERFVKDGEQ